MYRFVRKVIIKLEEWIIPVFFKLKGNSNIVFLCFHDITDGEYTDEYCIKTEDIKKILEYIRNDIISINEIENYFFSKERKYVISFDDGYASLYDKLFGYLIKYGIHFVTYISTDYLEGRGYLTERQLNEIAKNEICEIGSHMCSHSKSRDIKYNMSYGEWKRSKKILEEITGKRINNAALPYGSIPSCSIGSILMAYLAGYKTVALTMPYMVRYRRLFSRFVYKNKSNSINRLIFERETEESVEF